MTAATEAATRTPAASDETAKARAGDIDSELSAATEARGLSSSP
ncbi:hypothetical protein SCNU_13053 [Gordonia neofelifaecis NRRL B-59395]|uniref:Uncharacterized protein n=1 Tax=Gordonia neofelifaecis NRRL B-59395 TaxID=644548 RepID=F1YL53_9ACTN|nr:hypothetical protein SCNU_13053 [Gordonia neofelifaecis NRRL B-59395]